MIQHLPKDVFWVIIKQTQDAKDCVALWSCCKLLYQQHSIDAFWNEISLLHHPFQNAIGDPKKHIFNPKDIYWINHAKQYGCINCHRPFPKNKNYNKNVESVTIYNTIHLYTCNTCKNILGDSLIHSKYIHQWQNNLCRKIINYKPIFGNYYGINQIQQFNSYRCKCIDCLKNIRNLLCPHYKCGACCHCKFHKSRYNNILIDTIDTIKIKVKIPRKTKHYYIVVL